MLEAMVMATQQAIITVPAYKFNDIVRIIIMVVRLKTGLHNHVHCHQGY